VLFLMRDLHVKRLLIYHHTSIDIDSGMDGLSDMDGGGTRVGKSVIIQIAHLATL